MPDINKDVVLLLIQSDTTNGSTTFVDSSTENTKTLTNSYSTNVEHVTSDYKFGSSCISITDGGTANESYINVAHDTDFDFGGDPFTIAFWHKPESSRELAQEYLICKHSGSVRAWVVKKTMSGVEFQLWESDDTFHWCECSPSGFSWDDASWTHVAVVSDGTTLTVYLDGESENTLDVSSISIKDLSQDVNVGSEDSDSGYGTTGWYDEILITNDAQWTEDFTPPTTGYTLVTEMDSSGTFSGELNAIVGELDGTYTNGSFSGDLQRLEGSLMGAGGLSGELSAITGTFTGYRGPVGTFSGELSSLSGELSGAGKFSGELGAITGSFTGTNTGYGTFTGNLPRLNGEFTGVCSKIATFSGDLAHINGSLTGTLTKVHSFSGELPRLSGVFTGYTVPTGTFTGNLSRLTGSFTGNATRVGGHEFSGELQPLIGNLEGTNSGMAAYGALRHVRGQVR